MLRFLALALGLLPLNAMSRMAGRLARARLPGWILHPGIRAFARVFGANLGESAAPVESFHTFQDFFTRELKDGARVVDASPDAFVSPCDGAWGVAGRVEDATLLQLKGRPYSLGSLLGSDADARDFEGGGFATLYLAPRDYHRFHTPADVDVVAARYLTGRLWPVNGIGLQGVDGLFAENERICAWMCLGRGPEADVCLVAVGATMVGSIEVVFDSLTTNVPGAVSTFREYAPRIPLARGAEWGRFGFGSTIVVLTRPGAVDLDIRPPGALLRMGERIGTIQP